MKATGTLRLKRKIAITLFGEDDAGGKKRNVFSSASKLYEQDITDLATIGMARGGVIHSEDFLPLMSKGYLNKLTKKQREKEISKHYAYDDYAIDKVVIKFGDNEDGFKGENPTAYKRQGRN